MWAKLLARTRSRVRSWSGWDRSRVRSWSGWDRCCHLDFPLTGLDVLAGHHAQALPHGDGVVLVHLGPRGHQAHVPLPEGRGLDLGRVAQLEELLLVIDYWCAQPRRVIPVLVLRAVPLLELKAVFGLDEFQLA